MRLLGSVMRHAPMGVGPLYNVINTGVHLGTGTANQWGKSPSLLGGLMHALFPHFNPLAGNAAPPPASYTGPSDLFGVGPPGSAPTLPPAVAPPVTQTASPNAPAAAAGQPDPGMYLQRPAFDLGTGRLPGAPAFTQTLPQALFPGNRIGGDFNTNPYNYQPGQNLGYEAHAQGVPGWAQQLMAEVRARNQI